MKDVFAKILGVILGILIIIGGIYWIYKDPYKIILAIVLIGIGCAIINDALEKKEF